MVSSFERGFVFGANTEQERERFAYGNEFIRSIDSLSESLKGSLESGKPVPYSSLPARMRELTLRMLETRANENREKGKDPPPVHNASDMSTALVRIERKPGTGFNRHWFAIRVKGFGTTGFRINDYEEKQREEREKSQKLQAAGGLDPLYEPKRFEIAQKEAKLLPALKRKVELSADRVTFPDAMRQL